MRQKLHALWPGRLSAIEIAEGALLADIAVVFHILSIYLPFGGAYPTLLVPIPFTILILRHNLYAGFMAFCVAVFVAAILTGIGNSFLIVLEAGAGVYLGLTMKYRMRHFPLILLGVTCSALMIFGGFMLLPRVVARSVLSLQRSYLGLVSLLSPLAARIGLGGWYMHTAHPALVLLGQLILNYWYIAFFAALWAALWFVVIVVYFVTNFFVRLLGYNVRPFPGGIIEKVLRWLLHLVVRLALRLRLGKHWLTQTLLKESRRQSLHFLDRSSKAVGNPMTPLLDSGPQFVNPAENAGEQAIEPASSVPDAPLIDIQHVTYSYERHRADERPALNDVSLQVQQGEYLVILGHNGSGKSTLARHCNALLTPTGGRVLVAGMDTRDKGSQRAIRDTVGMIFQNPDNQIIATVVEEDVAWSLSIRGMPAPLIAERVKQAMAAVGISNLAKLTPQRLSGGQRQRLAIAGMLALRPRCIVADESTAQLDPLSRIEIVRLLHQLNREHGLTIIQVTHLLEEAALAQRVVVMEQGRIVMEGPPEAIFADLERLRRLKLAIPEPIELASRLRSAGLPLSGSALTVEAIAEELVS